MEKGDQKVNPIHKKGPYGYGPGHVQHNPGPHPTALMNKEKSKPDGYPGPPPPGYRGPPPPGYPPNYGMPPPPGYSMGPPPNYRGPPQDMRDMRMPPHHYPNEEERYHMEHMNRMEEERAKHMTKMGGMGPPPPGYRRPNMGVNHNYDPHEHYQMKKSMKKSEDKEADEDIHYDEYGRPNPYYRGPPPPGYYGPPPPIGYPQYGVPPPGYPVPMPARHPMHYMGPHPYPPVKSKEKMGFMREGGHHKDGSQDAEYSEEFSPENSSPKKTSELVLFNEMNTVNQD